MGSLIKLVPLWYSKSPSAFDPKEMFAVLPDAYVAMPEVATSDVAVPETASNDVAMPDAVLRAVILL